MTKEFYYHYADALASAREFAKDNNGAIADSGVSMDDRSLVDCYRDDKAANLCWSVEVAAIEVDDNDTGMPIGFFAYWE